jgi:hypothetical protein
MIVKGFYSLFDEFPGRSSQKLDLSQLYALGACLSAILIATIKLSNQVN